MFNTNWKRFNHLERKRANIHLHYIYTGKYNTDEVFAQFPTHVLIILF